MTPVPFVTLGRVVKAHGLGGEVSVTLARPVRDALREGMEVWFVPPPAGTRTARVQAVRDSAKGMLVKFSGVDDIDAAREISGTGLLVAAAALPEAWSAGESDSFDAEGIHLTDTVRGFLGEVVEVIATGANDVWVVQGPLGEILVPVIDDVVLEVDAEARSASVRLLPGLLSDEAEDT